MLLVSAKIAGKKQRTKSEEMVPYHEHGTATVEPGTICNLPDILDVVGIGTDEPFAQVKESTFYCFCVTFESTLSPPNGAVRCFNFDKHPTWGHSEYLDRTRRELYGTDTQRKYGHLDRCNSTWC